MLGQESIHAHHPLLVGQSLKRSILRSRPSMVVLIVMHSRDSRISRTKVSFLSVKAMHASGSCTMVVLVMVIVRALMFSLIWKVPVRQASVEAHCLWTFFHLLRTARYQNFRLMLKARSLIGWISNAQLNFLRTSTNCSSIAVHS